MLDTATAQELGAFLFVAPIAGAAAFGRSLLGPRGRTVAARAPARGTEALWLGTIGVAQLWTLAVALAPGWFYADLAVGGIPLSTGVQVTGLVLWGVAAGLAAWSFQSLGRFMTVSIRVTEGHELVQKGPYAHVRHPTYTAVVILVVGLALVFLSVPLLIAACVAALLARHRANLEEDLLRSPEGFGAAYDAYRACTGRFLPRLRRSGP
ncbi:MAG TPA: isoprenylcysteine carboxylmethyltransferase family protein [Thermoplasmata archaeon]|nr:isoprenylcysteine carboxylmethyltransferase family protein [Thermoplasmata archaeon]